MTELLLEPSVKAARRELMSLPSSVHLVGICGVGMAGLAYLLAKRGLRVSGCDLQRNRLAEWLEARGIAVYEGHDPGHVAEGINWVIHTAAVSQYCPEIKAARARGLAVFSRGTVLPALLEDHVSVAVAGTHGKTTTTAFITQMLKAAGKDPSWCIGGEVKPLGGVAGVGNGGILVVEADESDGTLALYAPDVAVVTNIEFDHMERFGSVAEFENCFRTFVRRARKRIVFCADNSRAAAVCSAEPNALSYGLAADAHVRAENLHGDDSRQSFEVLKNGVSLGEITILVPGRHNILNALAAVAVGLEMGLAFEEIQMALAQVVLPRRRFERVADHAGITIISDYAHHPTEIAALVATARNLPHRRLLAVFQPHRYTRTLALGPEFPSAFDGVDDVVLVPVYAASEQPLKGGTVWDLYAHFRTRRRGSPTANERGAGEPRSASSNLDSCCPGRCALASSLEQVWAYFSRRLRSGDVFLVVGAGDVEKIALWAAADLPRMDGQGAARQEGFSFPIAGVSEATKLLRDVPLASLTTLKVGGNADLLAEVATVADLAGLLQWAHAAAVPVRILGGGSNVLVSDLGVRGLVVRLLGSEFRKVEEDNGIVRAGAAVRLAALLKWLEAGGWTGLEFLEGIPGTMGGAARMNAGAWGCELAACIAWVRCLGKRGEEHLLNRQELSPAYRRLAPLQDLAVVEVGLKLERETSEKIRARREAIAARRQWMRGLRSAGSIFKNPPHDYAGRLIEAAGLKGKCIGGARVCERHGNVIVTEDGATASDVRALIEIMRAEVASQFGVLFETEVEFFE